MQNGKMELLENLDAKTLEWLLETAAHAQRLVDVLEPLKENGIEVSLATLRRFLWSHKEKQMLEDGEAMKGSAETLVKRGLGEVFKKGTLETIRQRFYEQAMLSVSPEETQKLYGELLKEETKWKEMEMAERRMALAEEQARLQRLRLKLELKKRKKVEIKSLSIADVLEDNKVVEVAGVLTAPSTEQPPGGGNLSEVNPAVAGQVEGNAERKLLRELAEILNRGGDVSEKFLEARRRINEGLERLGGLTSDCTLTKEFS